MFVRRYRTVAALAWQPQVNQFIIPIYIAANATQSGWKKWILYTWINRQLMRKAQKKAELKSIKC